MNKQSENQLETFPTQTQGQSNNMINTSVDYFSQAYKNFT